MRCALCKAFLPWDALGSPPLFKQSNLHNYQSLFGALRSLVRAGPSEAFLGFLPSALRDAPYAGLFVVFYEAIKHKTGAYIFIHSYIDRDAHDSAS